MAQSSNLFPISATQWTTPFENSHRWLAASGGLAVTMLCLFVLSYRLHLTPDILMDEILYYVTAFNIANRGAFTWDYAPIFVHPPGQFLVQSMFLRMVGLDQELLPFVGTYTARLLNVWAAALTISILYSLMMKLLDYRVAFACCLLLLSDPFVIRINRRNMLETLAELWVVLGLFLFWHYHKKLTLLNSLMIGSIFGMAFLTKELTIFAFLTIPIYLIITGQWNEAKWMIGIGGIGICVWSLFPIWSVMIGQGDIFLENKTFNLQRLLGMVQVTGWNREGVSLVGALQVNFPQYATSYLLLLLGIICTVYLFICWRTEEVRFFVAMSLAQYAFFAFSIVQGALNDQFFYFLMVPVAIMVGMAATRIYRILIRQPRTLFYSKSASLLFLRNMQTRWGWINAVLRWVEWGLRLIIKPFISAERLAWRSHLAIRYALLSILILLTVAVGGFNTYRWVKLFAMETDNSLYQVAQFIETNAPEGAIINTMFTSRDRMLPYMLPGYEVMSLRNPSLFSEYDVEYSIISTKNLWGAYGEITPNYFEFVQEQGELVFSTYGNTFWEVEVYEINVGR